MPTTPEDFWWVRALRTEPALKDQEFRSSAEQAFDFERRQYPLPLLLLIFSGFARPPRRFATRCFSACPWLHARGYDHLF